MPWMPLGTVRAALRYADTSRDYADTQILGYGYEPQRIQIHEWIPARPKATKRIVLGYPCHAHTLTHTHKYTPSLAHTDSGAQREGKWPFTVVAVEQLLPQQNTRRLRSGSDFLAASSLFLLPLFLSRCCPLSFGLSFLRTPQRQAKGTTGYAQLQATGNCKRMQMCCWL